MSVMHWCYCPFTCVVLLTIVCEQLMACWVAAVLHSSALVQPCCQDYKVAARPASDACNSFSIKLLTHRLLCSVAVDVDATVCTPYGQLQMIPDSWLWNVQCLSSGHKYAELRELSLKIKNEHNDRIRSVIKFLVILSIVVGNKNQVLVACLLCFLVVFILSIIVFEVLWHAKCYKLLYYFLSILGVVPCSCKCINWI